MGNTVDVRFRLDKRVKESVKHVCEDLGITMTEAFTMFANKIDEIKNIPSGVYDDPFYSESNQKRLEKVVARAESELAKFRDSLRVE